MKKLYTYVLISFVIFASLSMSPAMVHADDGVGPKILNVRLDQSTITKGQKVIIYISAEDKDGLYSTGELEVVTPDGDKKIVTLNLQYNEYSYDFDFQSSFWTDEEYGVYQLNTVTLYDRYGNQEKTILNKQFELLNDVNAPVVNRITLSQKTLYATREEFVKIDIEVDEIGLPKDRAILYFKHKKTGQEKSVNINFDYEKKIYSTKAYGWENHIFGEWEVNRVQLSDVAGNTTTQFGTFLGDNSVTLLNPEDDTVSPELVSTSFLTETQGSSIVDTIKVEAKDNAYVSSISVTVNHRITGKTVTLTKGHADFLPMQVSSGEKVTAHFSIELYEVLDNLGGYWDISEVEIIDRKQNKTIIRERINSVYIDKPISDLGVRVISKNTTLSDTIIHQPVFILPNVTLSIFSNVRIAGDVYALGSIRSFGGLTVFGTLNAKNISLGHNSSISNGEIQVVGSNYFPSRNLTEQVDFVLPLNTNGGLLNNGDGTFDIAGLTLPLSNKIRINGVETTLDEDGKFKASNIPINAEGSALIQINAMNGLTYSRNIKVYGNERPIATTSKGSGIYLSGTQINFTSSKEGTVYYETAYNSEYYGMYKPFNSDFVLNNDVNVKYYSVDPTGIKSEIQEEKYRVFSVYKPKASSSTIEGSGSPGIKVHAKVGPKIYTTTIDTAGRFFIDGVDLTKSTNIQVFATDEEHTSEAHTIDVVDDLPIIVEGAEHEHIYNHDITITYNKGKLYRGREIFVPSGSTFSSEGLYELYGVQSDNTWIILNFTIDKTAPQVSDIQTGKAYKQAVYPTFTEGAATLNGLKYTSGAKIDQEGEYVLEVIDNAGNKTNVYFTIDYQAPVVTGVENGKLYNQQVTPVFTEGTAKLNGSAFASGTIIKAEGLYELIVQDAAGNLTTRKFEIDVTPPKVTNVVDGATYRRAVIYFTDGVAKLNDSEIQTAHEVTKDGSYNLVVTDRAGNTTKLSFEVDSIAPIVSGVENGMKYNRSVTPTFTEGTGKLNGKPFTNGTLIQSEGAHELIVEDKAGNTTTTQFTIDVTAPVVTGVTKNHFYNRPIVISFNEGTAILNGKAIAKNYTVNKDGSYELKVKDSAGNETSIAFELDQLAPVVTGVEAKAYRQNVTPVFGEGTALLNGKSFVSGTLITTEGNYELKVIDQAKNETIIRFSIDKKPVIVTGVESNKVYQRAIPVFTEGIALLNGTPFTSGTPIEQSGNYTLTVTDEAGNETKLTFSVDSIGPKVTGFTEGINNYREVSPTFTEGTSTLNGKPFVSGTKVMQEGKHVLRVTDQIGNETVIPFTIDRTAPIVTGVKSKQLTNQSVVIQYNEGTATLNGKRILKNWSVKTSGNYTLRVTDQAGNTTVLTFTIDKSAPTKPTVSTLTNKSTKVTGKAEKGSTVYITYNGRTYATKATTAGIYSYSLKTMKAGATVSARAKDAAGNLSSTASVKVLNTFATFTINTVKAAATSLTGKGNKGATVQAFVGTKAISKTAKVDSKGNYKLTIPRQKAGVTVTVKMTQSGYQEMKKTSKVVK